MMVAPNANEAWFTNYFAPMPTERRPWIVVKYCYLWRANISHREVASFRLQAFLKIWTSAFFNEGRQIKGRLIWRSLTSQ